MDLFEPWRELKAAASELSEFTFSATQTKASSANFGVFLRLKGSPTNRGLRTGSL